MNKIWVFLMLSSLFVLTIISPEKVLTTLTSSCKSSILFCFEMCAIYAVWLGLLEVMKNSKITNKFAKLISPLTKHLFKTNNPKTQENLAVNLSANMIGIGGAATPSGIEAMKGLEDEKSKKPTFGMIMLLVINATSIQVLPTTVIALRASLGSVAPHDIFLPTLIGTICSTVFGILFVFMFDKFKRKKT